MPGTVEQFGTLDTALGGMVGSGLFAGACAAGFESYGNECATNASKYVDAAQEAHAAGQAGFTEVSMTNPVTHEAVTGTPSHVETVMRVGADALTHTVHDQHVGALIFGVVATAFVLTGGIGLAWRALGRRS